MEKEIEIVGIEIVERVEILEIEIVQNRDPPPPPPTPNLLISL